jgi:hypothetical protein
MQAQQQNVAPAEAFDEPADYDMTSEREVQAAQALASPQMRMPATQRETPVPPATAPARKKQRTDPAPTPKSKSKKKTKSKTKQKTVLSEDDEASSVESDADGTEDSAAAPSKAVEDVYDLPLYKIGELIVLHTLTELNVVKKEAECTVMDGTMHEHSSTL